MSEKIRLERKYGWTTLPNELLRDKDLSLKAKGALAVLLSLPPDWDYTVHGLAVVCRIGRDAMRNILKELETGGYLERRQAHEEGGVFGKNEYIIRDYKQEDEHRPTENPSTDEPSTGKPLTENPAQLNKDLIQERNNNTPYSPPQGDEPTSSDKPNGRSRNGTQTGDYKPKWFEAFWRMYPRRDNKQQARKAWNRLKPDPALCTVMKAALERQIQSPQWTKDAGQFIPMASTWINQRRWEDEGIRSGAVSRPPGSGGWAPDPEVTS